jgi:hypothetical protein
MAPDRKALRMDRNWGDGMGSEADRSFSLEHAGCGEKAQEMLPAADWVKKPLQQKRGCDA